MDPRAVPAAGREPRSRRAARWLARALRRWLEPSPEPAAPRVQVTWHDLPPWLRIFYGLCSVK